MNECIEENCSGLRISNKSYCKGCKDFVCSELINYAEALLRSSLISVEKFGEVKRKLEDE